MTWNPGWKFKVATGLLGATLIYIVGIGAENVTPVAWSFGGAMIGIGISDLLPD